MAQYATCVSLGLLLTRQLDIKIRVETNSLLSTRLSQHCCTVIDGKGV